MLQIDLFNGWLKIRFPDVQDKHGECGTFLAQANRDDRCVRNVVLQEDLVRNAEVKSVTGCCAGDPDKMPPDKLSQYSLTTNLNNMV